MAGSTGDNRINNLNDEEHHGVLHGYVGPQTSFNNNGGFEAGESFGNRTNHNLQKENPIGLKLSMSESIFKQIKLTINEQYKENKLSKLKASNMQAIYLNIGSWQWVSENEGDLVVKFYYGKKKLVWEFLFGSNKKKIEIRWSQVSAINTFVEEDNKGRLEIELMEKPEFYEEVEIQAKKHTKWAATNDDFTGGQALICRRHTVLFPPRALDEHFKNLLQRDRRLFNLSQQPFPTHNYPLIQNQIIDFSCNKSVQGCSSSRVVTNEHQGARAPYVPNLVQRDTSFVGLISATPIACQDSFLQNKGMESWNPSQIPEYTNGSKLFNQNYQMNCMTNGHSVNQSYVNGGIALNSHKHCVEARVGFDNSGVGSSRNMMNLDQQHDSFVGLSVPPIASQDHFLQNKGMESWSQSQIPRVDQSYVNERITLNAHNPWLPVEGRVGFDNSGIGSSGNNMMNHMRYIDDTIFIDAGFDIQESFAWLTNVDYCLSEFDNNDNYNGNGLLNQMGCADNGMIPSFDLAGGNGGNDNGNGLLNQMGCADNGMIQSADLAGGNVGNDNGNGLLNQMGYEDNGMIQSFDPAGGNGGDV